MSLSRRSSVLREEDDRPRSTERSESIIGEHLDDEKAVTVASNSPPLSREEVREVFESWRNNGSAAHRSDEDSGFGPASSSHSESQQQKDKVSRHS